MELVYKIISHNSPEYKDEVILRYNVLRKPLGLSFSASQLAEEAEQVHIGAYTDNKLVACLLFVPINDNTLKMRQVAVEPSLQRKGIGQKLVAYAEYYAVENGYCRVELHARETAKEFYTDLGYETIGSVFLEVGIPHYKMVKDWCSVIGH